MVRHRQHTVDSSSSGQLRAGSTAAVPVQWVDSTGFRVEGLQGGVEGPTGEVAVMTLTRPVTDDVIERLLVRQVVELHDALRQLPQ
jgi:hypothetical protein